MIFMKQVSQQSSPYNFIFFNLGILYNYANMVFIEINGNLSIQQTTKLMFSRYNVYTMFTIL